MVAGEVIEVLRNKKKLLKIFGEKEKEVEDFISENRINLKDDNSLFMVFSFYNRQVEEYDPLWPE